MRQFACAFIVCAVASAFAAAPTVHVTKEGASRVVVSIETAGGASAAAALTTAVSVTERSSPSTPSVRTSRRSPTAW